MKKLFLIIVLWVVAICQSLANQPFDEKVLLSEKFFEVASTKKLLFLCASIKDCKAGNLYIFSNVINISYLEWKLYREDILESFQSEVEEKFPKNIVEISVESASPLFDSRNEALIAYNSKIKEKILAGKVFELLFSFHKKK